MLFGLIESKEKSENFPVALCRIIISALAIGICFENQECHIFFSLNDEESVTESKPSSNQGDGISKVPFVPFDVDLEYWEKPDEMEAPSVVK